MAIDPDELRRLKAERDSLAMKARRHEERAKRYMFTQGQEAPPFQFSQQQDPSNFHPSAAANQQLYEAARERLEKWRQAQRQRNAHSPRRPSGNPRQDEKRSRPVYSGDSVMGRNEDTGEPVFGQVLR